MRLMQDVKNLIVKYKEYLDEFDINVTDKVFHISYISIKRKYRNKGYGTLFIRELIQVIRINNYELTLIPASANTRLYNRLIKYYTRLGLTKKTNNEGFIYFTTNKR